MQMYTLEDILDKQISLLLNYISQGYLHVFDLPFLLLLVGFESSLLMFQILSFCNFQKRPFKAANFFNFSLSIFSFFLHFDLSTAYFYFIFYFYFSLKIKRQNMNSMKQKNPLAFITNNDFIFNDTGLMNMVVEKFEKVKNDDVITHSILSDVEYVFGFRHKKKSCLVVQHEISFPTVCHMPMFRRKIKK